MIGVVGPRRTERIANAIESAGHNTVIGDPGAVLGADPDLVVAVGEGSIVGLVRAGIDVPLLPVGTASAPSFEAVLGSVDRLAAGAYETRRWPTFSIERGTERVGRAAFDAMLVTSDPASISEYRIAAGDLREHVRADGVVIATPAGSHGYASAAGGPVVTAETDAASIVPVGAFRMDRPRWTYDFDEAIEVAVTREEEAVTLLVDGREAGSVETSIAVAPGRPIEAVAVGE